MVLLIAGVVVGLLFNSTRGILDAQKRSAVRTQLNALDAALVNFVALNKRLPCPANGTIASGAANAGVERPAPCNAAAQTDGVLPWVTLGLSEGDASDPWNGRITYRVQPALAAAPLLMDMSQCDPSATGAVGAGGACQLAAAPCTGSSACTAPSRFLADKGLDVWDGQNGTAGWNARVNNAGAGSGAAYVLISHGPTGGGAFNASGQLQSGQLQNGTTSKYEITNLNGRPVAPPATMASAYQDAPLNDNAALLPTPAPPATPPPPEYDLHFDDYLSHPSIMTVLVKANLGPRAH